MLYLEIYEDNPKKTIAQRLEEATRAYELRMGQPANLILVNERDQGACFPACEVRVERRVRINTYQIGHQEGN